MTAGEINEDNFISTPCRVHAKTQDKTAGLIYKIKNMPDIEIQTMA